MVRRFALSVVGVLGLTLALTVAPVAAATPAWNVQMGDLDYIVNTVSYDGFNAMHLHPPAIYSFMDWSTDGCSAGIIGGGPYHFDQACYRHDFSWRNLKRITSQTGHVEFNERNKYVADERFYNDMKHRCTSYNIFARPTCYATAYTYFKAVRSVAPYASAQTLHDNPSHFSW